MYQNGSRQQYSTTTPLTSIALVKTAAVGGTGKVGDVITYTFAVTILETQPLLM
jgi:hypothetical protein